MSLQSFISFTFFILTVLRFLATLQQALKGITGSVPYAAYNYYIEFIYRT